MTLASFASGFSIAMSNIRAAKMRAFLTVLGVIIGTGTIIGVGSILAGLDGAITELIRSFGPNTLIVFKFRGGFRLGNLTPEEWKRKPLTYENAVAISERAPAVEHVSPYLFPDSSRWTRKAKYKGQEVYSINLGGTEESYAFGGTEMLYGRFLTDTDNRRRLPVCVIGEEIQKAFFGDLDPSGKWINVMGRQFEVIGAMKRPAASFPGQEDRRVLVPYFTLKKMFPSAKENMLVVIAREGQVPQAIDEVRVVLRQERRVPYSKPDNFWISTAEQMVEEFRNVTSTVTLVMIVLSSIGLLVGGIGVMNIMLISVTERTSEIGVRKAIGARRSDIRAQFLMEAMALTLLGGGIGILLGAAVSFVVRTLLPSVPATLSPLWITLGFAISAAVGLFFGYYPANRAAGLDPIVCLRYE